MIIRNIMQDEYLYHNYVLQFRCLLVGTHAPKIIGKKVTLMGALNVWNIIMFYTYCVYWDIK